MVGQYLRGTIQAHRVMENLVRNTFHQNLEVSPHVTLYLFEHRDQHVEYTALK